MFRFFIIFGVNHFDATLSLRLCHVIYLSSRSQNKRDWSKLFCVWLIVVTVFTFVIITLTFFIVISHGVIIIVYFFKLLSVEQVWILSQHFYFEVCVLFIRFVAIHNCFYYYVLELLDVFFEWNSLWWLKKRNLRNCIIRINHEYVHNYICFI